MWIVSLKRVNRYPSIQVLRWSPGRRIPATLSIPSNPRWFWQPWWPTSARRFQRELFEERDNSIHMERQYLRDLNDKHCWEQKLCQRDGTKQSWTKESYRKKRNSKSPPRKMFWSRTTLNVCNSILWWKYFTVQREAEMRRVRSVNNQSEFVTP